MGVYFFDTSALVKAYVSEVGTGWVRTIVDPASANDVYVLRITHVEMTSAFIRRRNTGSLAPSAASALLSSFRSDFANEYLAIDVTATLLAQASSLVEQHGLRAYDAVQLAAAIEMHSHRTSLSLTPLVLVSADADLNAAAQAEGISVDDPNNHP